MDANSLNAAIDRFFRSYFNHCVAPDEDTLLNLLNALHSLNDKLQKEVRRNLFGSANFVALKALRNLFHHHTELIHEVKIIPVEDLPPMTTDLLIICLVPRALVERARAETDRKYRERVVSAFDAFKWHGSIVNIQPCVFNVAVDVFELVAELDAAPLSDAHALFRDSYRMEEQNGHDHRVTGDIWCSAGYSKRSSIRNLISRLFADYRRPKILLSARLLGSSANRSCPVHKCEYLLAAPCAASIVGVLWR